MYWLPRRCVLVPTDFSVPSVDAIHTALAMVESGHDVHVLHVQHPIGGTRLHSAAAEDRKIWHAESVARLEAFLEDHELTGTTPVVLTGNPALRITDYARDQEIDLIVIASHGYQTGEHITLGSTTERVLHYADCPVLVLRPDGRVGSDRDLATIRQSHGFASADRSGEGFD